MLGALRRSRLVSLVAVFVLFTALPASFATWHEAGDDPDCAPPLVVHDHDAHQVRAADRTPAAPEHCLLCHWAQSLRGATDGARFILPASLSAGLVAIDVFGHGATTTAGPSGRAPPLRLL